MYVREFTTIRCCCHKVYEILKICMNIIFTITMIFPWNCRLQSTDPPMWHEWELLYTQLIACMCMCKCSVCAYVHVCEHVCNYVCKCVYVYVHVYVHVCVSDKCIRLHYNTYGYISTSVILYTVNFLVEENLGKFGKLLMAHQILSSKF